MEHSKKRLGIMLLVAVGLGVWFFLAASAMRPSDTPEKRITQTLEYMYNCPDAGLAAVAAIQDPEEAAQADADFKEQRYGGLISEGYKRRFYVGADYYQWRCFEEGAAIAVKQVDLRAADRSDKDFYFTVTLVCTDRGGIETTLDLEGTIRLDDQGLMENMNPFPGSKELFEAVVGD